MRGNILIVDDEQQILTILPAFLSKHEYECDIADSVTAAASLLGKNTYDIVITDKNMPAADDGDEGGLELIRYIKEHDPTTEVILMTGYASLESAISAMKHGAFDYIIKPFELSVMTAKVDRIREYQNFLNPETIMNTYRLLHNEILDVLSESGIAGKATLTEYLQHIDEKIDYVFRTFKSWERIISSQRDRLAAISGYAEQIADIKDDPIACDELIQNIIQEAGKRL